MNNPCAAHRGWSGRAPENTMASIQMALSEPDIEWIEIDVQLSKDHIPVVIHDYKLRRTTNGKGQVRDKTAAELAELDAGSWFSPLYRNERIPTLEAVLQAVSESGKCRLNIELKTDGIRYPYIEEQVLKLVRDYRMEDSVVITSFHFGTLHRMHQLSEGELRTGFILDGWRDSLPEELKQIGSDFLSIDYGRLTKDRVNRLQAAGIQVMAWTINDERSIRKIAMLDPGIIICTNHPDRWRNAMQSIDDAVRR
ncbi:glycerophosphodiester phosphodiesterase [Paenibacillus gorillae]|uniref:glycerophosphodiester phosphodiesterase n=1 Tax=Paenibacillus gorillae TaxID=1243662 RepID=UPI0005A6C8D8|nr:glycerophosphodiester phosphodiesterase family protein [Paenibacillus gorillae]